MIEIKDLLSRYEKILNSKESGVESVRRVISSVLGFPLNKEDIKIKDGTVYLNIKPIYKNEILLKKEFILSSLKEEFNNKPLEDIR